MCYRRNGANIDRCNVLTYTRVTWHVCIGGSRCRIMFSTDVADELKSIKMRREVNVSHVFIVRTDGWT